MLTRRQFMGACGIAAGTAITHIRADQSGTEQHAQSSSFDHVIERARQLAAAPYQNPHGQIPKPWLDINYDQHRAIRFKPERALWRGERLFELQFFHPGLYFDYPVAIHVVADGQVKPLAYDPNAFTFGNLDPNQLGTEGLGFAGFRVHYPLNNKAYADEFAVFLGASYFRLLGRDQHYGLSARGLAIDTAESSGEEFPLFEAFWIEQPQPQDTSLIVYALLNSPSLSGAYRFVLRPRTDTQAEVQSVLFTRQAVTKLGVAPLTSMFLYGEDGLETSKAS